MRVPILVLALASFLSTATTHVARAAETTPAAKPAVLNVGVVIFDGLFITEFSAPFDVYKHVGDKVNVFTVAPKKAPIKTYEGVVIQPDYGFADAPPIDVLVVPSGNGSMTTDLQDATFVDFVRRSAKTARFVTSHCWGAFTLAQAGCLDAREATTFPSSIGDLGQKFPKVKAVKDRRFVVSGNVVTSNGGLAAYEASLYVVEQLFGKEKADAVASGLVFAPENRRNARAPGAG
jgi:transcriptional regulator GlxA family with amidase domain